MAVYPYPIWEITVQEEQEEEEQEEQNELDMSIDYIEIVEEIDSDNDESYSIPQDTLSEDPNEIDVENNALRTISSNSQLNTFGFFPTPPPEQIDDISMMPNDRILQIFLNLSEEMVSRGLSLPTLVR